MSCHIVINGWSGEDQLNAAAQLARIFRMDQEEANGIVQGLMEGNAWQFPHQVSDHQSQIAQNFLTSIGFEVDRLDAPAGFGDELGDMDQDWEAHEEPAGGAKKGGFFGRLMQKLRTPIGSK